VDASVLRAITAAAQLARLPTKALGLGWIDTEAGAARIALRKVLACASVAEVAALAPQGFGARRIARLEIRGEVVAALFTAIASLGIA
jgi:hypothetical protein